MAKKIIALVCFLMLLVFVFIYGFYFSKPTSFLTNEELVEEINRAFPKATASLIQDTIRMDERHVLVPFISKTENYGLSYWVWKNMKWQVALIDTKGEPTLWMLKQNDPSSFFFVWNVNPNDQLSSIHFYLLRDRGYRMAKGAPFYTPRIQMEKRVSIQAQPYGSMQLPDEWASILNATLPVEQEGLLAMLFGWIPFDQKNQEIFPENTVNGSRSNITGEIDLEDMWIINKTEIENPR